MKAYYVHETDGGGVFWAARNEDQAQICAAQDYWAYQLIRRALELEVERVECCDDLAADFTEPMELDWEVCTQRMLSELRT